MIKIDIDFNKLTNIDSYDFLIKNTCDYIENYKKIIEFIEKEKKLNICIQNHILENWFRNMSNWYGNNMFEFETIDARKLLKNIYNVEIPDYITNKEILDSGILEEKPSIIESETFEDLILRHYYTEHFTHKTLPKNKIVDIIYTYNKKLWDQSSNNVLVNKVFDGKIKKWKNNAVNKAEKNIIKILSKDISKLEKILMKYKVLRSYPSIAKKILGHYYTDLKVLNFYLVNLEIDDSYISDVIKEVEYELNNREIPSNTNEFEQYINYLSGNLLLEYDFVEKILDNKPGLLNIDLINIIKSKFYPILDNIEDRIEKLNGKIKPNFPREPKEEWDIDKYICWLKEEYLPFFSWADRNDKLDEKIYELGDNFSKYIYNNWERITSNSKKMIFDYIPNNYDNFSQTNKISIILIIDNLLFRYLKYIKKGMFREGFVLEKQELYLSMIPSITEISKKCLLSGKSEYKNIDNKNYINIVNKGWVPYFEKNKEFKYIPNINKFYELRDFRENAFFINYLPLDRSLHKPETELGITHEEEARHKIKKLVQKLSKHLKENNIDSKVEIHVISDHGSTRIPSRLKNDIDIDHFKNNKYKDKGLRIVKLDDKDFNKLSENLKTDCYFIDRQRFGTEKNYICAKKSNRFYNINKNIYLHGGLNPEEIVIPHLIFQSKPENIENIEIYLPKNTFRYSLQNITIEVKNPNNIPLEDIKIDIHNSNIHHKTISIKKLKSKNKQEVEFKVKFSKIKYEKNYMNFEVKFVAQDKLHSYLSKNYEIEMKSMIEKKGEDVFDFDNI